MKKLFIAIVISVVSTSVLGAGFGIYEASARGNVLGGGLVGSTKDASSVYYNPANMTEMTNVSLTVGVSLINPFADEEVNGKRQQKMNAGWFPPPHAFVVVPLSHGFTFGFGTYCEYGLGTKYDNDWDMSWDTTETTIEQFTFSPTLAYKVTDWWSVAAGARMSYATFENYKNPLVGVLPGVGPLYGRMHMKGDDLSCGWLLSTQLRLTDDLSFGAVYRSRINHKINGDMYLSAPGGNNIAGDMNVALDLPSSVTFGLNYDFTEKFRGGVAVTWTEWSTVDMVNFNLPIGVKSLDLKWDDAWRMGFGFEYDFTSDFCGRIGYTYDLDPSEKDHGTTMLPPGDRHIVGFGFGYKIFENLRADLGYNFIIMESTTRNMYDDLGKKYEFKTDNAYSHIVSLSLSYSF